MLPLEQLDQFMSGGQAEYNVLRKLNEALRANRLQAQGLRKGAIGYQTPSTPSGEEFSPLVPQSIEDEFGIATYATPNIALTKELPVVNVSQNVHQWNTLLAYNAGGPGAGGFMGEGGLPAESSSTFVQGSTQIKYLADYRTVTDVATMTGLLGGQRDALALQMSLSQQSLVGKNEWNLFHGDSDVRSLAYDGILKQITDYNGGSNVTDNRGAVLSLDQVINTLGRMQSTDAFALPDTLMLDPASFTSLATETGAFARYMADNKNPSFAAGIAMKEFSFMSPYGGVRVVAAPFIDFSIWAQPTAAVGDSPPSKPTLTSATTPVNAASLLEAGDYRYSLIAIAANGAQSTPTLSADIASITVAAGDSVNLLVDDVTAKTGANPVTGYILYRGAKNGAFSTIKEVARVPVNADSAGGATLIIDLGLSVYNTGKAWFTRMNKTEVCFHQLLDTFIRPLGSIYTAQRFATMRFGSPTVKIPQRQWVITNIGKPSFGP